MVEKKQHAISPTRAQDYAEWYQQVIRAADLADTSPVRGCMVIKPWGYGLWENIRRELDCLFKTHGVKNAYFPLFIPLSLMEKEAKHVEGFAKECAVVTHHRLESGGDGSLVPAGELDEPLVVRPTSETIIGAMFAKWVQSYRDLPLLINQWANIVRWEMRTRMFLRTTEFLWQEGHTVYANESEAREDAERMLGVYADFAENCMALPVFKGEKTESERFPGAVSTYSIEAMMQDRKALQAGTSHFLGQTFARSSGIKYLDAEGREQLAWTSSWGVSTRLVGALIMAHGDDDGLVLPPRLTPAQVVILPVIHKDASRSEVLTHCENLAAELKSVSYAGKGLGVELDAAEGRGGEKTWGWIKKGVPVRIEIGPRDIAADSVSMSRRDRGHRERTAVPRAEICVRIVSVLDDIQHNLFERARAFRDGHTRRIDNRKEFYEFFTPANAAKPEVHGGFALSHWSGEPEVEESVKNDLSVTIRCIPLNGRDEPGKCVITGKPSSRRALFAKAY